jgi:GDP-4-dehydro-6-deoxy-D-mannose reductase
LITGYCGFVGLHLAAKAAAEGYEVWGTDRVRSSGTADDGRFVETDLLDEGAVTSLLDEVKPDLIAHLAAQSSVRRSFDSPNETILNNTIPVLHILGYLKTSQRACRLLAVGSADEYGPVKSPADLPLREDSAVNPVNPYALAKAIQNQYCNAFAELYGVDAVITRSFNHTGSNQRETFVLPSFAKQIIEIKLGRVNPKLAVGNLEIKRDFLDVNDVCSAYIALLRGGKKGETYNVCSGVSHRIRDMLDKMCELAGVEVDVFVDPDRLRPVDTPELRGDAAKLRRETDWEPVNSIEQTLGSVLDFWEKRLSSNEGTRRAETTE